jgi:hypothetical protein
MPVKPLTSNPNLDHLRYQAKDLLKAHAARDPGAAQRIGEFHPRFNQATDAEIFNARLRLSDAQLAIAREYGFPSWPRLKRRVEKPTFADDLNLPYRERIEDVTFRRAVDLLDAGDVAALRAHLGEHPSLVHQHVLFEGGNYFRNPTLLEFVAENPIRNGTLPANIVQVAEVILEAVERDSGAGLLRPRAERIWRAASVHRPPVRSRGRSQPCYVSRAGARRVRGGERLNSARSSDGSDRGGGSGTL